MTETSEWMRHRFRTVWWTHQRHMSPETVDTEIRSYAESANMHLFNHGLCARAHDLTETKESSYSAHQL